MLRMHSFEASPISPIPPSSEHKPARNETNINRDAVDVGFKLRSPSMITFDMNACMSDSKIEICIIW